MMRLSEPHYSFEQSLDECSAGITGNDALRQKLDSSKNDLITGGLDYSAAAMTGELYTIKPIDNAKNEDPIVIQELTKSELVKLYGQYFVPKKKPARKIYESLLNAAKEKCPYCGGIGKPRNLDHYLPEAQFPQFSLLPRNLVPACRDCNMDGNPVLFATTAEDQIIQPYLDDDRFFLEQWIFAIYQSDDNGEPGTFEYFVKVPEGWRDVDKYRVQKHFEEFGLALRYSTKAAELLGTVLLQIEALRKVGLDNGVINTSLLKPGVAAAPFVNHWQRGMYQALTL